MLYWVVCEVKKLLLNVLTKYFPFHVVMMMMYVCMCLNSGNASMGDEGWKAIFQVLPHLSGLRRLDLG